MKRITTAYYDPRSRSVRLIFEDGGVAGQLDTEAVAGSFAATLNSAVQEMRIDKAVRAARRKWEAEQ